MAEKLFAFVVSWGVQFLTLPETMDPVAGLPDLTASCCNVDFPSTSYSASVRPAYTVLDELLMPAKAAGEPAV